MSHINVPMPAVTSASKKIFRISDFTGGICMMDEHEILSPSAFPDMRNLLCSGGVIKTREGIVEDFETLPKDKTFHSRTARMFFGCHLIHIGNSLYTFNMNSQKEIYSEMPDVDSFVFEMNSKLYFFTKDRKIFFVDKEFNVTTCDLPLIQYMTEAKANLSEYIKPDIADNCLLGAITIEYVAYSSNGRDEYHIPLEPDDEFPVKIYYTESKKDIPDLVFTRNGTEISFNKKVYSAITIEYTPKKESGLRNAEKIFNCKNAVCYGGENSKGNRVFFFGNPDYPGHYFYSELLDPLTVPSLSYDIIGNGYDNINAMLQCKGSLIAFSDTRIDRIIYSFDVGSGATFTVKEISASIGCDMPGSVQLVDNRPVFAHSQKGVHIIISSEYTDEMSVRSISANINGNNQMAGFFDNCAKSKKCCSIDYNRTYRLFIGNYAYVWDYANTPYLQTEEPSYAEKVLSWYLFELPCVFDVLEDQRTLCCACTVGNENKYGYFSSDITSDFGNPILSSITTRRYDFSMPESKKVLCEVYLSVVLPGGDLTVVVGGDEDIISSYTFDFGDDDATLGGTVYSGIKRICLPVPKYESVGFALYMYTKNGAMGIRDASFRFISDGIYHR